MEQPPVDPASVLTDYQQKQSFSPHHIVFLVLFLIITPVTLISSMIALASTDRIEIAQTEPEIPHGAQIYAALPQSFPSVSGHVIGDDARVLILKTFLEMNKSDLTPYAELLVQTADMYHLDWKLIPAIAQKESGLCRVIPENSHNCWGWGIHSAGTLMFDNYPEAIETVAKGLKEKYIDMGYTTPDEIMKKYAHPDSTTWAEGVSMYMDQIKNLDVN